MNTYKLLIVLILFTSNIPVSRASQIQPVSSIREAVQHYIASVLTSDTEYSIKQIQFDPRLQLPLCTVQLKIFGQIKQNKSKRNSIGVRCGGRKKWTIYTSVIMSIYKDVIVLSQSIRRDEIFNKNMFHFEKKDITTLRSGFVTDAMQIVNKQATRNLSTGAVIIQTNFKAAKIIKRGEKIYITANTSNLSISMAGIAMMDGVKGQNIRVKNIKSQQIIQATVAKPGHVMVIF